MERFKTIGSPPDLDKLPRMTFHRNTVATVGLSHPPSKALPAQVVAPDGKLLLGVPPPPPAEGTLSDRDEAARRQLRRALVHGAARGRREASPRRAAASDEALTARVGARVGASRTG